MNINSLRFEWDVAAHGCVGALRALAMNGSIDNAAALAALRDHDHLMALLDIARAAERREQEQAA